MTNYTPRASYYVSLFDLIIRCGYLTEVLFLLFLRWRKYLFIYYFGVDL